MDLTFLVALSTCIAMIIVMLVEHSLDEYENLLRRGKQEKSGPCEKLGPTWSNEHLARKHYLTNFVFFKLDLNNSQHQWSFSHLDDMEDAMLIEPTLGLYNLTNI